MYLGGPTFELGGPTFEIGGPIFESEVLEITPTPLFEQPLKIIAHSGRIFERLQYIILYMLQCTFLLQKLFSELVCKVFMPILSDSTF